MIKDEKILISAQGITKAFNGSTLLKAIDFDIKSGDIILLEGRNGSGKTTLINLLTGYVNPDRGNFMYSVNQNVKFCFPIKWWGKTNPFHSFSPDKIARLGITRTWQEVRLFNKQTILENIVNAIPNDFLDSPTNTLFRQRKVKKLNNLRIKKAQSLLKKVGLEDISYKRAEQLSLGQSKRVEIARAMAMEAQVLIMDEPLSGLDKKGILTVLNLIKEISSENNMAIIVVEHYLNHDYLSEMVNSVWTLRDGILNISKPSSSFNEKSQKSRIDKIINTLYENKYLIRKQKLPMNGVLIRIEKNTNENSHKNPLFSIKNLNLIRGASLIDWSDEYKKNGLSIDCYENEVIIIFAPNGWGKTSLLEAITGIIPVHKGDILIKEKSIVKQEVWKRTRKGIKTLSSRDNIFTNLSSMEMLEVSNVEIPPKYISDLLKKHVSEMSGGEKQKLMIGCHSNDSSSLIHLFDEPFLNLDENTINEIKYILMPSEKQIKIIFLPI